MARNLSYIWSGGMRLTRSMGQSRSIPIAPLRLLKSDCSFHSSDTIKTMLRYRIGVLEDWWESIIPPIQRASADKRILELRGTQDEDDGISKDAEIFPARSIFDSKLRQRTPDSDCSSSAQKRGRASLPQLQVLDENGAVVVDKSDEIHSQQQRLSQDEVVTSFRDLIIRMENDGLYNCNYSAYLSDIFRISSIFLVLLFFLHRGWVYTSATLMGTFWHQLVFIAHDAGHLGITHNYQIDSVIGMTVGNYLGGLSMCWWKSSHNIHHLVTNSPSHDADIQHLPFLAVSSSFFSSLYSTYYERIMPYTPTAHTMMKYQAWMYYPVLCFGRFNLYALSWNFLINDLGPRSHRWHRYYEIVGQIFFWTWFGYYIVYLCIPTWSARLGFVLLSHAITMPLHVQFTLSHFAMSTTPRGIQEPWVLQQLRTTMDVDCPPWMDWFHGGLQFQTIHHLFPRLPRHNLRAASERVKMWCKETGCKYEIYGFVECNGRVIGRLEEVAKFARAMRECQKVIVERGDYLKGEWE